MDTRRQFAQAILDAVSRVEFVDRAVADAFARGDRHFGAWADGEYHSALSDVMRAVAACPELEPLANALWNAHINGEPLDAHRTALALIAAPSVLK